VRPDSANIRATMRSDCMQIALRVLSAISDHREPMPGDIEQLMKLAESSDERSMPLDELACAVIVRERRLREQTDLTMRFSLSSAFRSRFSICASEPLGVRHPEKRQEALPEGGKEQPDDGAQFSCGVTRSHRMMPQPERLRIAFTSTTMKKALIIVPFRNRSQSQQRQPGRQEW